MSTTRQKDLLSVYEGARIAIAGLARTSVPLVKVLAGAGARITVFDKKTADELKPQLDMLADTVFELKAGADTFEGIDGFDYLFPSPGINPNRADFLQARAAGVKFGYEIELTMKLAECPVIGITGSSGKTTTTTLIGLILSRTATRKGNGRVMVGGNIGQPLVEEVLSSGKDDFLVLEMSSFQLKFLRTSPSISAVLNITPNHLDVHPGMDDYIASKSNILAFQGAGGYAVLGADDANALALAGMAKGRVLLFSVKGPVDRGAWLEEGWLWLRMPGSDPLKVARMTDIKLPGMHNVQNVLAAIVLAAAAGAAPCDMQEAIKGFAGVEHRLEKAGESRGVVYINDSIATSPARTIAALEAMDRPIVLIAGGYDKHLPFDGMAEIALGKVKRLVTLGVTAGRIEEAFRRAAEGKSMPAPRIERASSFDKAVEMAADAAEEGDVVLMSPACASYDMFNNFEERGRRFKDLIGKRISRQGVI